jgi:hypothetical protein
VPLFTAATIGRYGGILAKVRADDLGARPMTALIARMSLLLAVLPHTVPGVSSTGSADPGWKRQARPCHALHRRRHGPRAGGRAGRTLRFRDHPATG